MKYRYPRHKFPKRDISQLSVTLHGESLIDSFTNYAGLIQALISFSKHELVAITMTPIREDQSIPDDFRNIESIRYEEFQSRELPNWFSVRFGSGSALASASLLNPRLAEYEFGYRQDSAENQRAVRLLKDLEAHKSLDADIFVTEDYDALALRDRLQDLINILILNVSEALDYLDVHLKRQGKYVGRAFETVEGKSIYYWDRLCELAHSFQKTCITCAIATSSLPNGEQVQSYLHSFSARVCYMLEAKDLIASQFYLKSDNKVQHEMLRELNYFVTLTTGSFDALAWLFRYFYQFRPDDSEYSDELRYRVTLKLKPRQHTNGLISHIEQRNDRIGLYLRCDNTRNLINVFYPPRHTIQHRHPLRGIQYVRSFASPYELHIPQSDMDKGYSLAVLDEDTEKAISLLDFDDPSDYFTVWGVRKLGHNTFLEPYKFVLQALNSLTAFYENVLTLLDIGRCNYLTEDDMKKIEAYEKETNLKRPKYAIPFLLKRTVPPISPKIPRLPVSGDLVTSEAKSNESIASYGVYPMYFELLKSKP